jgi:hypothetical protein
MSLSWVRCVGALRPHFVTIGISDALTPLHKGIYQSHKKNVNMLLPMMDLQVGDVGISALAPAASHTTGLAVTD